MTITVNKTNALQYIASYQDLTNAFGLNVDSAINHYSAFGRTEGREFLFDGLAYINSYADLIAAFGGDAEAGARHYLTYGIREGRDADLYDDGNDTFTATGDDDVTVNNIHADLIIAADGWTTFGSGDMALTADLTATVADNDVVNTIEVLLGKGSGSETRLTLNDSYDDVTVGAEYVASGHTLTLNGVADVSVNHIHNDSLTIDVAGLDIQHPTITAANALDYIASYGDLIAAFGANVQKGVTHFASFGEDEGRFIRFDGLAYINAYEDLIAAFGDNAAAGALHYLTYGIREGRDPNYRTNVELNLEGDIGNTGSLTIDGVQSNMHIHAESFSGAVDITIVDDGEADAIEIVTGAGLYGSDDYDIFAGEDGLDTVNVDAGLLEDNSSIYVSGGVETFTVNEVQSDVTVNARDLASGILTVNAVDDESSDTIHVYTGSDDTYVNDDDSSDKVYVGFDDMAEGKTITLTGSADFEVSGNGYYDTSIAIDASEVTGTLDVYAGSGGHVANTLTVTTGSNDTYIVSYGDEDSVTVNAGLMLDDTVLTLSGSADFTVNGIDASMEIDADYWAGSDASNSLVTINTVDDGAVDSINILAGAWDMTVNVNDALDEVNVEADYMRDGAVLKLDGSSDVTVNDVDSDITIDGFDPLTGTLDVTAYDDTEADTIRVLTGTNDTTVNDSDDLDFVDINFDGIDDNKTIEINGSADFNVSGYNDVSLTVDAVDTSGYVAVSIDGSGAANTLTVLAGSYNTFVGGFDENDSVVIDAYRMGSNLLTLSGSADFEVNNVDSDLNITANGLSGSGGWVSGGSLTVNAHVSGGNNDIQIWGGTGNITVNDDHSTDTVDVWATLIADGNTVDLNGDAQYFVSGGTNNASFTVDATDTTNVLEVHYASGYGPFFGEDSASTLTVETGTNDTYIYAWQSGDSVIVEADLMADNTDLNASGSADFTVNDVQSSIDINSGYFGLDGELTVNAIDDEDADSIEIWAGHNYTTVNDVDELDDVIIYADRISAGNDVDNTYRSNDTTSNDAGLTLTGKADYTVYDLSTSLLDSSAGDDTIYLAAANASDSGGGVFDTDLDRRDMSIDLRAFDGEGNAVSNGNDLIVLDNTLIDGNTKFMQIFGFDTEDYADRVAINTGWGVSTSDTDLHYGYGGDDGWYESTATAATDDHAVFDMNFASELDPNNGADISGFHSGSVIEISSSRSVSNPTNLDAVKGMLGLIAGVESNAEFLVIVYSGEGENANAFLYHVYSDNQGDGFDFHDTDLNGDGVFDLYFEDGGSYFAGYGDGGDVNGDRYGDAGYGSEIISEYNHDMIDLVGVFYNVGADSFTSENFSHETNIFGG